MSRMKEKSEKRGGWRMMLKGKESLHWEMKYSEQRGKYDIVLAEKTNFAIV